MELTHATAVIHYEIIKIKNEYLKNQYIQYEYDPWIKEKNWIFS